MFLPLASTMSVFNCWAVGEHAEKTSSRSSQVWWRAEGDEDRRDLSHSEQFGSKSPVWGLFHQLLELLGYVSSLFCHFPEDGASNRWSEGFSLMWSLIWWWRAFQGSHLYLFRVIRSALQIHFFSPPLLGVLTRWLTEGCPDSSRFSIAAVVLRQHLLLRSCHFALFLPLCFSSPFCLSSSVTLFLCEAGSFFPPLFLGADSSAGCRSCECCAAPLSLSFCWLQGLNGRAQKRSRAPACPPPSQHSLELSQELSQWQQTEFMIG